MRMPHSSKLNMSDSGNSLAVLSIDNTLAEWGYSRPQLGQTILLVDISSFTVYSLWQVQNIWNFKNIGSPPYWMIKRLYHRGKRIESEVNMFVNPFVLGILATLFAEMALLIVLSWFSSKK